MFRGVRWRLSVAACLVGLFALISFSGATGAFADPKPYPPPPPPTATACPSADLGTSNSSARAATCYKFQRVGSTNRSLPVRAVSSSPTSDPSAPTALAVFASSMVAVTLLAGGLYFIALGRRHRV
jgi:hypothetical protein